MRVQIVNLSGAPNYDVTLIARMLQLYSLDIDRPWELAPAEVLFQPGEKEARPEWTPLYIFENPDAPGYGGFHDVDDKGRAYTRVFLGTVPQRELLHDPTGKGASLAALMAHEYAEMRGDLLANTWRDGPFIDPHTGKSATSVADELCDPVQEVAYYKEIDGRKVDCSDFVFPAWFNPRSVGEQYDMCRVLTAPMTMAPGGYVIVREAKPARQLFARMIGRSAKAHAAARKVESPTPMADWRRDTKTLPGARTRRRLGG